MPLRKCCLCSTSVPDRHTLDMMVELQCQSCDVIELLGAHEQSLGLLSYKIPRRCIVCFLSSWEEYSLQEEILPLWRANPEEEAPTLFSWQEEASPARTFSINKPPYWMGHVNPMWVEIPRCVSVCGIFSFFYALYYITVTLYILLDIWWSALPLKRFYK